MLVLHVNKSLIKFLTDFGPLFIFFIVYYKSDKNLIVAIITPDKEIVENSNLYSPAYIIYDNYEIILKWNRSLRFALAVCTLKDKFKNEL